MPQPLDYKKIIELTNVSVKRFVSFLPKAQQAMYGDLLGELKGLDTNNGNLAASVKNLKLLTKVKGKLTAVLAGAEYKSALKEYMRSYREVTKLMHTYYRTAEVEFGSEALLEGITNAAITDTVRQLGEVGVGVNVGQYVQDILRTSVTGGGSYAALTEQLRELLLNTDSGDGKLVKYAGQIATDALNQFSAQYSQVISDDLGYEWFKYDNTDIETTRPFCDAMTDLKYFHVSQLPALIKGKGLTYTDKTTGQKHPVPLYAKTGLPHGMIPGTDASNFRVRRGGYRCRHQCRPMNESLIPGARKQEIQTEEAYKTWLKVAKQAGRVPSKLGTITDAKNNLIFARAAGVTKSQDLWTNPDGSWKPERIALHKKIIADLIAKGTSNQNIIRLLGGAPANGKSTLAKSGKLPLPKGILTVNSDDFKELLPEYNQLLKEGNLNAADFVHEESSYLTNTTIAELVKRKLDFLSDGIQNGTFEELALKLGKYRGIGKKVRADYVTLDTELSLTYAAVRGEETGRVVPESYIIQKNESVAELFPQLLESNLTDELYLWDTNISGQPRLVVKKVNGSVEIVSPQLYERFLKKSPKYKG